MYLFKRSKKGVLKPLLIVALVCGYMLATVEYNPTYKQKIEDSSDGNYIREVRTSAFPYWKEEALPPAVSQAPAFLKAILPPAGLIAKQNGERQYNITRLRLLPVVWNPTIPIALRRLTV